MAIIKAAILGFGTVGQGVYEAVRTHQQELKEILGAEVEIVGVLVKDSEKKRSIAEHVLVTTDFNQILQITRLASGL